MQIIRTLQISLMLVVFSLLSLALPTPTEAGCGGDCSVVECGSRTVCWGTGKNKECWQEPKYCTECGGNGCSPVGCGPGQYECNRGCCDVGPVDNCPCGTKPSGVCQSCDPEPEPPPPPPPPPCVPSCGVPLCGQADGCGGTCASWDQAVWGAWGACNVSCGGGIQIRTNACGSTQGQVCNTQSCQGPWWQVKDGDITTNGDIVSRMPSGYYLDTIGSGGFPGIPVYGGSIGIAPGTISQTLWNANTTTVQSRIFNYSYFENLIPNTIVFNDINKLPTGSGVTVDANGYEWYKITGNLDTVGNIDFGSRKVILFIEGNLNIGGNINLTDGVGFFVSFVSGNISIAGTATSLEGIYESNGSFTTGVGTSQLLVRGSVASYGSITMQRDLADDTVTPAELFEFAPDQIVLFPKQLQFKRSKWAEVAP